MLIRDMLERDVHVCVDMGVDMHQESIYRESDYDPAKLWAIWYDHVNNPGKYCTLVAEHNNEVVGMFVGFAMPHYFGNDLVSCDLLLYVKPEHRGTTAAVRLVKAYEKWAIGVGCKEIQVGISTGFQQERTAQMFERLGFTDRAIFLKKRI